MSDVDLNNAATEAVLLKARRETLQDAASRINESAQREAPVDTGTLRRSHRINGPDSDARRVEVEATANYSVFVHEGTRNQSANAWLRRALDRETR